MTIFGLTDCQSHNLTDLLGGLGPGQVYVVAVEVSLGHPTLPGVYITYRVESEAL